MTEKKINLYDNPDLYSTIISYRLFEEEIDFIIDVINNELEKNKEYTLLDLGGGTGKIISMLPKNINAHLLDKSFNMCQYAKKKYKIKTICSDFINPALKTEYDIIISIFNTLSYITDINLIIKFFKNIEKMLKPKGIFIFSLPYFKLLEPPFDVNSWAVLDDDYNEYKIKLYYCEPIDYANQTIYQNLDITDTKNKTTYYVRSKKLFLFPLNIKLIIDSIKNLRIIDFFNGPDYTENLSEASNIKSYFTVIRKL
jgi:SAM-dependent methyltransferase